MNLMLRTMFNLRGHREPVCRLAVLIDTPCGIDVAECVRTLRPWSSWVTLDAVLQIGAQIPRGIFEALAANGSRTLMLLSDRAAIVALVREECTRVGMRYVGGELPPKDSYELALYQEVFHHDAELGGYNASIKGDPLASSWMLRMFSADHCRRHFPHYLEPHLASLWSRNDGRPLETVDVGCGPVSRLRWGALEGMLRVTGVDPLLDMYSVVVARHGLDGVPSLRCARDVAARAEDMADHLPGAAYDVAYSSNALDHTSDPIRIVDNLARVVRPGGILALEVFTREGSRENWWQLHQFDMYVNDAGRFVCESRDKSVREIFPADGEFEVVEIPINHASVTAVVARRV